MMQRNKGMRYLSCLVLFSLVLAVSMVATPAVGKKSEELVLKGRLNYASHMTTTPPFSGILRGFSVECGAKVEKGTVVGFVELTPDEWYKTKSQLTKMHQNITGQLGRKNLVIKKEKLIKKREAEQELVDNGFSVKESVESLNTDIEMVENELRMYDQNIVYMKADLDHEVESLNEKFRRQISIYKLPKKAPITIDSEGYVVEVNSRVANGDTIGVNTLLLTVSQVDPMIVQAEVFEHDIVKLKVGDVAKIRVDSLGDKEYEATLKKIAWTPVTQSFDKPSYYEIELEVENPEFEMKEGFQVQVIFHL